MTKVEEIVKNVGNASIIKTVTLDTKTVIFMKDDTRIEIIQKSKHTSIISQCDVIHDMYHKDGISITLIANTFNCSEAYIKKLLAECKVSRSECKRHIQKLKTLNGYCTLADLAESVNYSVNYVYILVRKYRLVLDKPNTKNVVNINESLMSDDIEELLESNNSYRDTDILDTTISNLFNNRVR